MMRYGMTLITCFIAAGCMPVPHGTQGAPQLQTETVQLTVTVKTPTDEPIENAPVEIGSSIQSKFALTNALGQAAFTVDKNTDEETLVYRLSDGLYSSMVPPAQKDLATSQYHAIVTTYAVKSCYIAELQGAGPYAVDLTTEEAVKVTGRIVDGSGQPKTGAVAVRSSTAYDVVFPNESGQFTLEGVVKGEDDELWIAGDRNRMQYVTMTATQLQSDYAIGDIVVMDVTYDAHVNMQMTNTLAMRSLSKISMRYDVTLVSASDSSLFVYGVDRAGVAYTSDANGDKTTTLPIPSGTYYIVPSGFGHQPSWALLESVRAGRHAQLQAAGVPSITVAAGATESLAFDATAAYDAVMSVGADLACPCGCN
jgi:hypothetical protein